MINKPLPIELTIAGSALLYGFVDPDITETIRVQRIRVDATLASCIHSASVVQHLPGGRGWINQVLRECRTQAEWDQALPVLLEPLTDLRPHRETE